MIVPIGTNEFPVRRNFPIITVILFAFNCAVFGYELYYQHAFGSQALTQLVNAYGVVPAEISRGIHFSSLLTSLFFHAGLLHLLTNMIFLLSFGDNVEDILGKWKFLILYLVCGIIASLTQVVVDPQAIIPTIGASGAIAGILASYICLFPKGEVRSLFFLGIIPIPLIFSAWLFIIIWFVIQIFNGVAGLGVHTLQDSSIAYFAHIGGFMAGWLLTKCLKPSVLPS